jgi:hypothetical protein
VCSDCKAKGVKNIRATLDTPVVGDWREAVIQDLANPFLCETLPQLCKKYGVTQEQFYKFKSSSPDFNTKLAEYAKRYRDEELALWKKLVVKQANEGDNTAIKMWGRMLGAYDDDKPVDEAEGLSEVDRKKRIRLLIDKAVQNKKV